jgi:GT2 family glycosyltransferase
MRTREAPVKSVSASAAGPRPDISIIVISFNTEAILRKCIQRLAEATSGIECETIVIDNNSRDGSAEMVNNEFPDVCLVRSPVNLGFAAANNLAITLARGRYYVLLNSDAFVSPTAIRHVFENMESDPSTGVGGGRLVGTDGGWQPSSRLFPSVLNKALSFTGLAARFPRSRFFGRFDRTWVDPLNVDEPDWVPGAFAIIRREAVDRAGMFDESFFLYYEEVDLCRRIKAAGYKVKYWPGAVVEHIGGESSRTQEGLNLSGAGAQLTLWRLRSEFLFYRKHHGSVALLSKECERLWHNLRLARNLMRGPAGRAKVQDSRTMISLIGRAWRETRGGRASPTRPW